MREAAFCCGAPAGVAGPCLRAPHTVFPGNLCSAPTAVFLRIANGSEYFLGSLVL